MKRRVEEFLAANADCEAEKQSAIHPRKRVNGCAWSKGEKLHSAPGGVYKSRRNIP